MGVLIMTNYLAIIRKLDFVDLFKYGYFLLNHAVSFDGDVHIKMMKIYSNRLRVK